MPATARHGKTGISQNAMKPARLLRRRADVAYQLDELTTDERDQPVYRLGSSYQRRASAAAAEQLEKAGCRLDQALR
jgi:hypothetical protein